jgi:NADH-quinone oxidoreductase subunit F
MDEGVSIFEYLKEVTEFFIHESCGKCVPCREGNRQLLAILKKLSTGTASTNDIETMRRLTDTMNGASFCGLGQTASVALNSALKHFDLEIKHEPLQT